MRSYSAAQSGVGGDTGHVAHTTRPATHSSAADSTLARHAACHDSATSAMHFVGPLLYALLLVGADLGARTLVPFVDLPIGVLTAVVGGPLFLVLVRSRLRTAVPS